MKTNRSQFFANRNMRKKGETSERYEQKLAYELLLHHLPLKNFIDKEYIPKDLIPLPNEATDLTGDRSPKLDIVVITNTAKIAIRLNGGYHDRKKQARYDLAQRLFLEKQPSPWTVIDFSPDDMPRLFATHETKPTLEETAQIYTDLYSALSWLLPLPLHPSHEIIKWILKKLDPKS